ncbi:MAG: hypothetical protein ACLGHN_05675 [Bacteriovoracia bacterium]
MYGLILLITGLVPLAVYGQGTMSTDSTEASEAEASLSGTVDSIDLREEEVQLIEGDFDPQLEEEYPEEENQEEPLVIPE